MGLRPKRSEISPVNNKPIAKASVEKDKGKLLCVGEIWKKSANTGIMGCTQYNDEKEANPAKNKDHKIAKKGRVPYSMAEGVARRDIKISSHPQSIRPSFTRMLKHIYI
jgi:hypothetical protein